MIQGFTTLLKGIVESHHAFRAKYQFQAMALNTMTVTTEEIVGFFNVGYTSVLAPLVEHQQKNPQLPKTPKLNATDGNKPQDGQDKDKRKNPKGEVGTPQAL
eukprot:3341363-Amphidinium_carterae.1